MNVAVQGCCHGALDKIYDKLARLETEINAKADVLLITGDFQAIRNQNDLRAMSVPEKYKQMGDFVDYYNGKKKAPLLTIFIGGNHEASNYMQNLYV